MNLRIIALLASLFPLAAAYDWFYGNVTLFHSESAYCDVGNYLTRNYSGPLSGFVPTASIERRAS